jgi:hypothetical protein
MFSVLPSCQAWGVAGRNVVFVDDEKGRHEIL